MLTVERVLEQLKYRYEREVNEGKRSALKKVCERDAAAGSPMVLAACSPHFFSRLIPPLSPHASLFIQVCGAVLNGCMEGLPPLEACTAATLALHFNGTFPAHWSTKLGFCNVAHPHRVDFPPFLSPCCSLSIPLRSSLPILISPCASPHPSALLPLPSPATGRQKPPVPMALRRVREDGGAIPLTCVAIARVYPTMYWEKNTARKADADAAAAAAVVPGGTMPQLGLKQWQLVTLRRALMLSQERRRAAVQEAEKRRAAVQEAVDDALADEGLKETGRLLQELVEGGVYLVEGGVYLWWAGVPGGGRGVLVEGGVYLVEGGVYLVEGGVYLVEGRVYLVVAGVYLVAGLQPSLQELVEGGVYLVAGLQPSATRRGCNCPLLSLNASRSTSFSFPPRQWTPLASLPATPPGREVDVVALVLGRGAAACRGGVADGAVASAA
ncbi:unnamed protein product [Closterium sp. NIES-65]|nr:unnamed protein product [Closterium sp. NIES-65]